MNPVVLHVDLTTKSYRDVDIPRLYIDDYIGGRGLGIRLLHDWVPYDADPLGPENALILPVGPLHATKAFYSSKAVLSFKSPQTGGMMYTIASSELGNNLHKAGYAALIITGKLDQPGYIVVRDSKVEFKDARKLWGMTTADADYFVSSAVRDPDMSIAVIGPAGENLVKYACVVTEGRQRQAFGRGGAGAVMGSKNLKAFCVKGSGDVPIADPERFKAAQKYVLARLAANPEYKERQKLYGTNHGMRTNNAWGGLPTRNWYTGKYPQIERYAPDYIHATYTIENTNCAPYCPNPCYHWEKVSEGEYAGAISCGPEYETIFVFGPGFDNPRYDSIVAVDDLCDLMGVDTISMGGVITWLAECMEKGIITEDQTDGINARFGHHEALLPLIRKAAYREGWIGNLLAEGSKIASEIVGQGSDHWAMHSKGLEFGGYEARGAWGQAIQYACSHRGGCHHDLGLPVRKDMGKPSATEIDGKGQTVRGCAFERIIFDSAVMCTFPLNVLGFESALNLINATTGRTLSIEEAQVICDRILATEHLYQNNCGFRREHDRLPGRLTRDPLPDGPAAGKVVPLDPLLDDYYAANGWEPDGTVSQATLDRLGIQIPLRRDARLTWPQARIAIPA